MKPSRSICKTGNEESMRRRVGIVSFILVVGAVALAAAMVGRVTAQDWRSASQEPVGLALRPPATGTRGSGATPTGSWLAQRQCCPLTRTKEHTSELQSRQYPECRL